MGSMTDELIGFLYARFDEDQAKDAAMQRERTRVATAPIFQSHPLGWLDSVDIFVSPDRWQAEIDVKRRLLDAIEDVDRTSSPTAGLIVVEMRRLLAVPYAAHPDYREEWRP